MAVATATVIAGITAATAVAGAGIQYQGQKAQRKAQRKQEGVRRRQLELENARERRKILRQSNIARADAVAAGAFGGALGGSSIEGATGSISNIGAANTTGVNQSSALGAESFSNNAAISRGRSLADVGGAVTSLGGAVVQGIDNYNKLA